MIVTEYIRLANQEATGETDMPSIDSEAYITLYDQVTTLILAWQNATDNKGVPIDWNSLWGRLTLSAVIVADQDTFAITPANSVHHLSDAELAFKVTSPSGDYTRYYQVVKPSELSLGGDRVALQGNNLIFAEPFDASDPLIGGTIKFEYYGFAATIANAGSTIPVDDPYWVVYRGAAALVRNDYVKSGQYNNLLNLAKEKWDAMVAKNRQTGNETVSHGTSQSMFPGVR